VYWSLAIEFQFYVLVGLALPALEAGNPVTRIGLVAAISALPLILPSENGALIVGYLPIFAAGLLSFMRAQDLIGRSAYWAALATLGVYMALTRGPALALASVLPAALITTVRLPRIGWVAWLGAISYSLYLLHVPIGGRVMNLAGLLPATAATEVIAVTLAFAVSIIAAYGMFICVERPARDLAAAIRYRTTGSATG
jgi:peptidoglycan/LPS O-acetylase OafA/YrhL